MAGQLQTTSWVPEQAGRRFIKIAVLYLVAGLSLGVGMGVLHDFRLSSVHAHVLLIGWATMVLSGVVYIVLPSCGNNWLAKVHYWLLNIGLPGMIVGLVLLTFGKEAGERIIAPSSIIVLLAVIVFAVNVFRNSGSGASSGKQQQVSS